MAPRRKAAESRKNNQATLQFGTQSKISKPFSNASIPGKDLKQKSPSPKEISLPTHSLPKKQDEEQLQLQEPAAEVKATPASTTSTAVVHEQARAEAALPKSKEDEQAEALTVKQLQAYWRAEEKKRTASRVHQADLSIEERILRHFDLCSQYGVSKFINILSWQQKAAAEKQKLTEYHLSAMHWNCTDKTLETSSCSRPESAD
ncbi:hypothetical protein H112_00358 [Trichophyton rubrum D6]|uniref:Uncharacterized protein n=3 Tax=Trichophyton TaxID=5550 RepID=F2T0E7_TRIRC|nr:uncharacterized protein TERG_08284 [Trichophyton rubrum CBS 118892]EZF27681.1 hypothetical protein H100_00359 [Trichophyton rubrum MR850]EZF46661.1 hypothetical protein H102_00358 [Trichophyton rubrum CBS 100081]EZF57326.1 hypothetical protein H103_00357 [Trichophyton rubrum CBS 288.86]EZF68013.1 hypothetical protein H104_00357 [Trichophyton rubrum CBS 289.86]EZF78636.1 hypothetical protein H105_00353 [Trichophyton soudanense CBS 452.61]EZF89261.1 hypothetical protein H110_00361 [Trichophy